MKQARFKEVQSFIINRFSHANTIQQADITFVGFATSQSQSQPDTKFDHDQDHMKFFSKSVGGESSLEINFEQVSIGPAKLYVKEIHDHDKLIRMVYVPIFFYMDTQKTQDFEGTYEQYQFMVLSSLFLNLYLKQEATKKVKVIIVTQMQKKKKSNLNVIKHLKEVLDAAKNDYYLENEQVKLKLAYVIFVQKNFQEIQMSEIKEDEQKQLKQHNEHYILIQGDQESSLHPINYDLKQPKLQSDPILLKNNYNVHQVSNYHELFYFNKFIHQKSQQIKKEYPDKDFVNELTKVLEAVTYPLLKVKRKLFELNGLKPNQINKQRQLWKSQFEQIRSLQNFNQQFGFDDYKINNINCVSNKPEPLLKQYKQNFDIYRRLNNEQNQLIHAMILDHINTFQKQFKKVTDKLQKSNKVQQQHLEIESKVLELAKIIVHFLGTLKQQTQLKEILHDYEFQFYDHLLTLYLGAYEEFCRAYKQNYGVLFNLYKKVSSLKSQKQQILSIVSKVKPFTELFKQHDFKPRVEVLQIKKQSLTTKLRLLIDNKPPARNKDVEVKIMQTKYDKGSTCYKLGLEYENQAQSESEMKEALRYLFRDLYKLFFLPKDPFFTDCIANVGFNQLQLLQKVAGLLKLLGHIQYSIQIYEKIGKVKTVFDQFNLWITEYHPGIPSDYQKLVQIKQKAVDYFKLENEEEKVKYFYDLLIDDSQNKEQVQEWKFKKFEYIQMLQNDRSSQIENAKKIEFPLSEESIEKIIEIAKQNEQRL